jgi:hypothetical protein
MLITAGNLPGLGSDSRGNSRINIIDSLDCIDNKPHLIHGGVSIIRKIVTSSNNVDYIFQWAREVSIIKKVI